MPGPHLQATTAIKASAVPLRGEASDYDALLADINGAEVVLLGEATHGSHEFYAERARLTQRLILEQGFTAVAVEADWPDASSVFAAGASPFRAQRSAVLAPSLKRLTATALPSAPRSICTSVIWSGKV